MQLSRKKKKVIASSNEIYQFKSELNFTHSLETCKGLILHQLKEDLQIIPPPSSDISF